MLNFFKKSLWTENENGLRTMFQVEKLKSNRVKCKRNVGKFLKFLLNRQDVWFDRFTYSEITAYVERIVDNKKDLENFQHECINFQHYLINAGYVEYCDNKYEYIDEMRISIKGYEYSQSSFYQRNPQIIGIFIGAIASFVFAVLKSMIDFYFFR